MPAQSCRAAEHQLVAAVPAFDPSGRIAREVGRDLAPSAIQPAGQIGDLCLGLRRPVERTADGQACGVPRFAAQQPTPGIGIAHPGWDEHVAPLQPCPEAFERGEDIGAIVGNAAGAIERMTLPGRTDTFGWSVGHAGFRPVFDATQVVQRRDHRLAGWRRVERDPLQQGGEQCAYPPPMRAQLLIPPVVGSADQAIDAGHGSFDVGTGDPLEQRVSPGGERQRIVFVGHDTLADATQDDRCGVEIAQGAQPGFTMRLLGEGEDIGCERLEELDRIVERHGLQGLEQGSEGCRAPWLVQRRQIGRLGGASAARQSPERGCRQVGDGAKPRPWPRMASMRFRCRSNSVGDRRLGLARRSSRAASVASSDVTSAASFCRCSSVKVPVRRCQSRRVARWRTRPIRRSSVVMPGSSTLCASSQVVARSNSSPGRSSPVQHSA